MSTLSRIVAGALLLAAPAAFAQSPTASASASARIYVPISVSNSTALNFGDIFADSTGGAVTLNPADNTRTTAGPALATTGAFNAAKFTVTGKRNATYAITLPADGTVSLAGPGTAALPVSAFTASVAGAPATSTATGLLPNTAGATQDFTVGGTLTLAANQTDGDYTGTFSVTVAYN